jgi:hypothetical protein
MRGPKLHRQIAPAYNAGSAERLELLGKLLAIDDAVYREAAELFGDEAAIEWLTTPAYGLQGKIPVDVAVTEKGAASKFQLGCKLLAQLDYLLKGQKNKTARCLPRPSMGFWLWPA